LKNSIQRKTTLHFKRADEREKSVGDKYEKCIG